MKSIKNLFTIAIFTFVSCKCVERTQVKKHEIISINDIAKNAFVDDYKIVYNKTKEYALITKSFRKLTEPIPNLMFFVYSKPEHKKIISDTLTAGDVYWFNDFAIRATEREQKAESRRRIYTYDVKSKEYILD